MIDDAELLQDYASRNSEAAFKELVDRHIGFVYATALRKTGRQDIAEDVAQAVFVILARKAAQMKKGTIVAGWLYRATHMAAAHARRDEVRRSNRERLAAEMTVLQTPNDAAASWETSAPLLDDALGQLGSKDRNAVLLRFFQERSLAEVGAALGCSEEAARKRVDRAVERLRSFFGRRGVLVSCAALVSTISAQAQSVPPTGLAHSACALVFGKGATVSVPIFHLIKQTMKTMLWSKAPLGVGLGLCLVAVIVMPLVLRGQPGMIDPDFNSRLPIRNSGITALALQPDGKILVGGTFESYPQVNGQQLLYLGMARLNQDGTVDSTFRSFDDRGISDIAVQKDGKIVVGGYWSSTNATKHANLCRLNPDGGSDPTFDPGPGTDWQPAPTTPTQTLISTVVRTLALQTDGRILLGGDFHRVGGENHPALARLNPDGSIDRGFTPPTRAGDQIQRILLQSDGKLIVSAAFSGALPPRVLANVLRLNPDGSVDTAFHQSPDLRRRPLALQNNGQLIACLVPLTVPGLTEPVRLVRLNPDGSRDLAFSATVSLTNVAKPYPQLFAIVSAPGGKSILLGKFNRVNGIEQADLARLNVDGTLDQSFRSGSGFEPPPDLSVQIGPALLQPDGKILFGGMIGKVNGIDCQSLARVLGEPPMRFLNVRLSTAGALEAVVSGARENGAYLESSSDLRTWHRVIGDYPDFLTSDTVSSSQGFYRAVAE